MSGNIMLINARYGAQLERKRIVKLIEKKMKEYPIESSDIHPTCDVLNELLEEIGEVKE